MEVESDLVRGIFSKPALKELWPFYKCFTTYFYLCLFELKLFYCLVQTLKPMYRVLTALEVADVVNVGSEGPIYLLGKTPLCNENWAFCLENVHCCYDEK